MRALLVLLVVMGAVFAETNFTTVIDSEIASVQISGISPDGDAYAIAGGEHKVILTLKQTADILNYSVKINPRNIERFMADMNVPLSGTVDKTIQPGTADFAFTTPDMLCGNYRASGEVYYILGEETKKYETSVRIKIPCKDFKSKLLFTLTSILPYSWIKALALRFGVQFPAG